MKTYLIGYDLNTPRKDNDYSNLFAAIKALSGTWWHCLGSTWIIKSDSTAMQICNALKAKIDSGDELLVVNLSGEGAWIGFDDKGSKWLKDYL